MQEVLITNVMSRVCFLQGIKQQQLAASQEGVTKGSGSPPLSPFFSGEQQAVADMTDVSDE